MQFNYIAVNTNLREKKLVNTTTKRKKQKNTIFEKYADS